jgi:hypothetical protein
VVAEGGAGGLDVGRELGFVERFLGRRSVLLVNYVVDRLFHFLLSFIYKPGRYVTFLRWRQEVEADAEDGLFMRSWPNKIYIYQLGLMFSLNSASTFIIRYDYPSHVIGYFHALFFSVTPPFLRSVKQATSPNFSSKDYIIIDRPSSVSFSISPLLLRTN